MALTTGLWDPLGTTSALNTWNDPWLSSDLFTMPTTTGAGWGGAGWGRRYRAMPIDVIELPEEYEVKADIPGQSKDKIKLNVQGQTLQIAVDRTEEEEEMPQVNYFRGELPTGYHTRNITLPAGAAVENLAAEYKQGVLIVKVPKREEFKRREPKKIAIQ